MKHVHKYRRKVIGKRGYTVYKCAFKDCRHFIDAKLVVGRSCVCWKCGTIFTLTEKSATLTKPHCLDCTGVPRGIAAKQLEVA